jgi:4-amino-4-deoxy-L-arabinose transferase-like glycosyltransferase
VTTFLKRDNRVWQVIIGIVLVGIVLRLLGLLFASTTEGDAFARVQYAWVWLQAPEMITQGVWLPLQTYYTALALKLTQEFYYTPILINIVLSAATAAPLYVFTRREFGHQWGWFVAVAFIIYPIALRNSLMPLSDTPFAFLVALALPFLALARDKAGNPWQAVVAGLCLTLAAALRYEAWVMILLLGIVLWRRPKLLVYFMGSALLFPVFWLVGSAAVHGNAFYSFHFQAIDTAKTLAERGGMSWLKRIARGIFFPGVLCFGMSAMVFGLSLWGAGVTLWQRRRQSVWLIPFLGVLVLLSYKSISGSMNLQPRYALVVGMLLLPFAVIALEQIQSFRYRYVTAWAALLLTIPFSYSLHLLTPLLQMLLADTKMVKKETPAALVEAIPRLSDSTRELSRIINHHLLPITRGSVTRGSVTHGLVLIAFPDIGHLVAYESRLNPDQICVLEAYNLHNYDRRQKCFLFVEQHVSGILAIDKTHWPTHIVSKPMDQRIMLGNQQLAVTLIGETEDAMVYRYQAF